jgi:hypothetical protein
MRPDIRDALRALDTEIDQLCEQVRIRAGPRVRSPIPVPDHAPQSAPMPEWAVNEPPRSEDSAGSGMVALPAPSQSRRRVSRNTIVLALAIFAVIALAASLMLVWGRPPG